MLKRIIDIVIALLGLVLGAPILLGLALTIYLKFGRPVLFQQQRPGLQGRLFVMYKFRTMTHAEDVSGQLLPDEQRLTPFGRMLRRTSLDELPELWNVLTGEMSLVGPRPLLTEYLALYTPEQTRRHEVRPGITGWAQVNGRNALSWEAKFTLDVWYVQNQTFLLDLKILFMTLIKVFKQDGISQKGCETAEKFNGSKHKKVAK